MMMTFGEALHLLKHGRRVARKGWNGKGMWLALVSKYQVAAALPDGCELRPWIGMKTATNSFIPWLASQDDMQAHDWEEEP